MASVWNHVAVGTGNAGEAIVGVNGTYVLGSMRVLRITDVIVNAAGAQNIRIRETNAAGNLRLHVRLAAAGTVVFSLRNPIEIVNNSAAAMNVVVTEDTAGNASTTTLTGKLD